MCVNIVRFGAVYDCMVSAGWTFFFEFISPYDYQLEHCNETFNATAVNATTLLVGAKHPTVSSLQESYKTSHHYHT